MKATPGDGAWHHARDAGGVCCVGGDGHGAHAPEQPSLGRRPVTGLTGRDGKLATHGWLLPGNA